MTPDTLRESESVVPAPVATEPEEGAEGVTELVIPDTTAGIPAAIAEAQVQVPTLARQYPDGVDGFNRLFGQVAALITAKYVEFERVFDREMRPLLTGLRLAMTDLIANATTAYRTAVEEAKSQLRAKIVAAHYEADGRKDERREQLKVATSRQLELRAVVEAQLVSMTGRKDANVQIPDLGDTYMKNLMMRAVAALIAVGALEYLGGTAMWAWISDPNAAIMMSVAVILGLTFVANQSAVKGRLYISNLDATRAFRRLSAEDQNKFSVEPFSTGDKIIFFGSFVALVVFSALILWVRLSTVRSDNFDSGGIAVAVGLLGIVFVYGLGEFSFSRPHRHEQYVQLKKAQDELNAVNEQVTTLTPVDTHYADGLEQAINEYKSAIEAAKKAAQKALDNFDDDREILLALVVQYAKALDMFEQGYFECCKELVTLVVRKFKLQRDQVPLGTDEHNEHVLGILTEALDRKYGQIPDLETIKTHDFGPLTLPEIALTDFTRFEGEVMSQLATSTVSRPPKRLATVPATL